MRYLTLGALVFSLMAGSALAQTKKKTVCWNDDKGQRMCGDTVPPQYAKKEQQVINSRGVVVETKAREKTPEELAEEARKAEDVKKEQEQARYDSFLMQTYRNVGDLEATRKERVVTLDGRIVLAEKAVKDMQVTVKTLHDRTEALKKANKEPDKKLVKQVRDYDKALIENMQAVEALKAEREKVTVKFDTDIARYKQLKGP